MMGQLFPWGQLEQHLEMKDWAGFPVHRLCNFTDFTPLKLGFLACRSHTPISSDCNKHTSEMACGTKWALRAHTIQKVSLKCRILTPRHSSLPAPPPGPQNFTWGAKQCPSPPSCSQEGGGGGQPREPSLEQESCSQRSQDAHN